MKHVFVLDGLDCANCAAKIERKIADTPGYSEVQLAFATKELALNCDKRNIIEDIQALVDSVEDGVTVVPRDEHEHTHDHEHEHGETGKLKLILLVIAAALFVASFILHFFESIHMAAAITAVAATVLSGYDVMISGIKAVMRARLDETTLMTVAVIAAMALGEYTEAAAVTVLFCIGELLEDRAVESSRRSIRKLADIRPDKAYVKRGTEIIETEAEEVAVGDIIEIPPHTRVPLDGVVISGQSAVDASSLTGESALLTVNKGDELLSGMMNRDATLTLSVTKPYADSAATRIVRLVEESARNKGNSEKLITRFARIYTPAMIGLSVVIALAGWLITGDLGTWVHRALVCLVASCPCSIVISVPLAYFAGIGAASRAGALIKGGRYVEALAGAKAFAFDKTGTLTDNNISVKEIITSSNYSVKEILQLAASAEKLSSHPIAGAIRIAAEKDNISLLELSDYNEHSGKGVSARYGEQIIAVGKADSLAGAAVTLDGEVIGYITLCEHIRPEAKSVLSALRQLGARTLVMLTGDRREAAEAAAKELGVTAYSELLPEDKVAKIESILAEDGGCCFVGDGINDAPVLSRSSCGIAMGLASDAAIESADMVLSSGTLSALPKAVRIARATMRTVRGNITFSLLCKFAVIALSVVGIAPIWLAVFADAGVCLLCVLNATRLMKNRGA